jgi:REP element-mobilizing transposase RayT
MTELPEKRRRSIRFQGWDYSWDGVYFITICTQNKEYLFGEIVDDLMHLNAPGKMILGTWEELPERFAVMELDARVVMPNHFHAIVVLRRGEPCVRPECLESCGCPEPDIHPSLEHSQFIFHSHPFDPPHQGEHKVRPYGKRPLGTTAKSIGRIVQAFKSLTTRQYLQGIKESAWPPFKGKLWQRNYYERIIRDEAEWERISAYIEANPVNWALDRENREVGRIKVREPWQV